ncbi:MAG: flagellar biosynthetic protein FliR [Campylobacterota bacterium]|nr:flagellar biosynthetic protein FliR [Campylobacterota bacterium]
MEALVNLLDQNVIFGFLLLFARIVSFMAFMPVFGHASVSIPLRISVSFLFTVFIFPFIDIPLNMSNEFFLVGLLSEVTLGLIASFLVNIIFSAVYIIGDFLGYAMALSMAMMFDPVSGSQQGLLSRLLYWIAIVIFFQTGMYEVTLLLLAQSFETISLGTFNPFVYDGISLAIIEIKRMFAFAFAFAFPLFFIGFILDIYYSFGTKSMPAFSPFIVTFQLKYALIFLFLIFGMDVFMEAFKEYFFSKFE